MSPNLKPYPTASPVRVVSLLLVSVLMLPAVFVSAAGQGAGQTNLFGLTYDFGVPLGINRNTGAVDWCDCNGNGTSYDHTVGLMARMEWPGLFGSGWGLSAESGLAYSYGHFTSDTYYDIPRLLAGPAIPDSVRYDFTVTAKYVLFHLGLRSDLQLGDALRASVGLWGEYRFNGTYEQTLRIQDSATYLFAEGTRDRVVGSGSGYASGQFGWGVSFALGTHLPLGPSVDFVPEIVSHLSPRDLASVGMQAFSAGLLLGVRFGGSAAELAQPPAPTLLPDTGRTARHLAARLDLYSADTGGNESPVVELLPVRTSRGETMQLLPYLFFARNSDTLLDLYRAIGGDMASPPKLPDEMDDRIACSARSVAAIGARLRGDPTSMVTVVGHVAAGEPAALASRRARRVRSLLAGLFGLDSMRIRIVSGGAVRSRPDGNVAPGVEILLPARLAVPLEHRWFNDEYRSPMIGLRPHIEAEAGLRTWKVEVLYGGHVVGRYSSDRVGEIEPVFSVDLRPVDRDTMLAPLRATLTVEDSSGQNTTTTAEIPVRARAAGVPGVQERRAYFWLLDESWLPSGARSALDSTIAALARQVGAGTRITLRPIAFGAPEASAELRDGWNSRIQSILRAVERAGAGSLAGRTTILPAESRPARNEPPTSDLIWAVLVELADD